ncbi:MAG: hypothetical protein CME06_09065 [Gemmatimonadetes bacterium]|nr:hypothetical protein [Gemmatimonadota bacterium]
MKEFDYISGPGDVLDFVLELMDADGNVSEVKEKEQLRVEVESESDEERLIGHRFETLESLQYLLGVMQAVAGEEGQVYLDVNKRREERDSKVKETGLDLVDEALDYGEAARSKMLLPSERRVIHRLAEVEGGVRTYSVGDGLRKVVVIEPLE